MSVNKANQARLKELIARQVDIRNLLNVVNTKISELEDIYLSETTMGNIIKGWDIDGKNASRLLESRDNSNFKERLFSCSSYETWLEKKNEVELLELQSGNHAHATNLSKGGLASRANKRLRKSLPVPSSKREVLGEVPDWNNLGDY